MISTQTPSVPCLSCGKLLDAAMADHPPKEGDISFCVNCGGVSKFDSNLNLKSLSQEEEENLENGELIFSGKKYKLKQLREVLFKIWSSKNPKQINDDSN